jgi:hypothetical protein
MPATQQQIDANRLNSQKSTGPKSPEGKFRAALNGWRHGLTGQVLTMAEDEWRLSRARDIENNRQ